MTTPGNGADRTALALIGLLLLAAGVVGLLVGAGVFGADLVGSPVLPDQVRTFAAETP